VDLGAVPMPLEVTDRLTLCAVLEVEGDAVEKAPLILLAGDRLSGKGEQTFLPMERTFSIMGDALGSAIRIECFTFG